MVQAKFSLTQEQIDFLSRHEALGFADKSSVVRAAVDRLRSEFERGRLQESARLYAEVYEDDSDLQALTDAGVEDWPE